MSLKFWFSVSEEEKDLLVFQKKSLKMLINHQNLRKHYNQCVGEFCYVWMFWAVAGLSCSHIIKMNSRLSSLLARRGKKPIICFSPGAWACRRVKLWGNLLRPPEISDAQGKRRIPFCLSQGPSIPDHSPGSCPRLPTSGEEGIPSLWPHQKPSPPHGRTFHHKFFINRGPSGKLREGTLQSVFADSESKWRPWFGAGIIPRSSLVQSSFLNICRLQNS